VTTPPRRFRPPKAVVRLYAQIEEQLQQTRQHQEMFIDDVIFASDDDPGPAGDLYFLALIRGMLSRCLISMKPNRFGPTSARQQEAAEALAWLNSRSPKFATILAQPEKHTIRDLLLAIKEVIEPMMDTPQQGK
jgi:DNA-binding protein H-NS